MGFFKSLFHSHDWKAEEHWKGTISRKTINALSRNGKEFMNGVGVLYSCECGDEYAEFQTSTETINMNVEYFKMKAKQANEN